VWTWDLSEAFGDVPPNDNPQGQNPFDFPLRLSSYYSDRETGNAYAQMRDAYSPGMGRFIEVDPIGLWGGLNVYAYVFDDPMTNTDPSGLAPPRPGTYYNPLPDKQSPPSLVENQSGSFNAARAFSNIPDDRVGTGGDWSGITVNWSMPKGFQNKRPVCGWDCPKNPRACSPRDPQSLTPNIPSLFAPAPGCVWRCKNGPFVSPQ
jgi:RHS repeat-associated protein